MTEALIMFLTGVGAIAILLAAIGILRMPDLYLRLSVTTKAATLGVGLVLVGAAFFFQDVGVTSRVLAIILFVTVTAPVSAQLIGRAAFVVKTKVWPLTIRDELEGMYDSQTDTLYSTKPTVDDKNSEENPT